MKELSIEEKAKRYDEAIERAKYWEKNPTVWSSDDICQKLFHELKESEDEKIRKELIEALKQLDREKCPVDTYHYQDWIDWLEKQGEKKSTQEIDPTPIFRIGDILKRKGKDYTFRVDRIQGGYYHSDRNHGAYFPIEQQDDWELVEQNPKWTPMDEQHEENLLAIIEGHGYPGEVAWLNSLEDRIQSKQGEQKPVEWSEEDSNMLQSILDEYKSMAIEKRNFLKSLKNRVQPQPKQEWTEEDKKNSKNILYILNQLKGTAIYKEDKTAEICIDWFKSLKDRVGCEVNCTTMWKPSDEQMIYLSVAIEESNENPVLESLYRDLKKLREE